MFVKFGAVMEKISVNQLKKRGAPQLGHAPQKGNIRYILYTLERCSLIH